MKKITARIVLAAIILVLSGYSAAAPAPQQNEDKASMQSMTVAELESCRVSGSLSYVTNGASEG
jgi:hypothetical protein